MHGVERAGAGTHDQIGRIGQAGNVLRMRPDASVRTGCIDVDTIATSLPLLGREAANIGVAFVSAGHGASAKPVLWRIAGVTPLRH
jgi:hypothetical protein